MHSVDQVVKGPFKPEIAVIGVGGAGGNAVNNMIASNLDGVNFVVTNTDAQALENSLADHILQLGAESTSGLGAGARPEIGRAAAEESLEDILVYLDDLNMVFITAGMGGGTGTGAAPVIAKACKERGILTVGVVTKPFQFEGAQRMRLAEEGIEEMAQYVDTLIVIPNQNLFRIANEKTTFSEAFRMADNVLQSAVKGVTDLMVVPGMINLDFADIRSATSEMGKAMMGTGEATGEKRAVEAAEKAINNPLLDDVSMKGARSVIINITGGHDLTLFEIEEACNRINDEVDPDATIIFGSTYDDSLEGTMRITVVATGIEAELNRRAATRPMRPTAINTQPRQIEEPTTMSDSFVARYPEPSRVTASASSQTTHAQPAQGPAPIQETQRPMEAPAAPEPVREVASLSPSYQTETPSMQEAQSMQNGQAQPEYVTEGSALRKVQAEPEQPRPTNYNQSVIPPYAPRREEQPTMESSLNLTPPSQPAPQPTQTSYHQQQGQKTPSLFDRITGRNRQEAHATREDTATITSSSTGNSGAFAQPPLSAERKTVVTNYDEQPSAQGQQGMLNIDAPAAQPKGTAGQPPKQDDLDIPAFLRRQIS